MPKDPAQATLAGRSMLLCWQAVGWCVGVITEANGDKRVKVDGEVVNFYIHYEIDESTSRSTSSPSPHTEAMMRARGCCYPPRAAAICA